MARTLLDLAKSMERRAAAFNTVGNEAKKRKVIAVVRHLAYNTPVDTSKALSSWEVGIGGPAPGRRQAFFPGEKGSTLEASAENTVNFAEAQLQAVKPGEVVYISNGQPYIRVLNDGTHSKQPGGFVEAATMIARKTK